MSLAYKLWKIGSVLFENDIKSSIKETPTFKDGAEPIYLNVDFQFKDDEIISLALNKDGISKDKLFFTRKIGGTSNAFYLYPNISVLNDKPIEKLTLLYNSLEYCTKNFCKEKSRRQIDIILEEIRDIREHSKCVICEFEIGEIEEELSILEIEKNKFNEDEKKIKELSQKTKKLDQKKYILQKDLNKINSKKGKNNWNERLLELLNKIIKLEKDNYIIWFSINGKTFLEDMPEVWNNWYLNPVEFDKLKDGYDVFTNEKTQVGYKTDVKVFSYDQYHDKLKYRVNENLPLSLESARNIKFAWMYVLDNLVFYYKGLEYIIIPNLLSDDDKIYKLIIERFVQTKKKTDGKRTILKELNKEEKKLKSKIEQLKKKKEATIQEEKQFQKISTEIASIDLGIIQEFNEQILAIDEHINSVTLDYFFTSINRTNLSFEIKGTIEDIIPSQMSNVVKEMHNNKINDLVKLGSKNHDETYLQDFFNRQELYFAVNGGAQNNKNSIFTERLYLAKLLLSDIKIKYEDLLKRFEFNRLYDYGHKKQLKDGVFRWIEYSDSFIQKENNIIKFLKTLDKIQE